MFVSQRKSFGKYDVVVPGNVSLQKTVPDRIPKPVYHESGIPDPQRLTVEIKDEGQIQHMRDSCRIAANVLRDIGKSIQANSPFHYLYYYTMSREMCLSMGSFVIIR